LTGAKIIWTTIEKHGLGLKNQDVLFL
jgi:hypothetical protein